MMKQRQRCLLACLLGIVCACVLFPKEASCLRFSMTNEVKPALGQREECISESVSEKQWMKMLQTIEKNWKKNAGRNLTDDEIEARLSKFKRPLLLEIGFLTMATDPRDQTPKPITYVITGPEGEIAYAGHPVHQEEISLDNVVGRRGPYTICFRAYQNMGPIDIEISYFHINMPQAKGTKYESSKGLSEEDIRDLAPTPTEEEMQYYAKEEHIAELKRDMRQLGSSVYHAHNEQQHVKQIQLYQHRCLYVFGVKRKWLGFLQSLIIVICAVLQFVFVRRLFRNKKVQKILRTIDF